MRIGIVLLCVFGPTLALGQAQFSYNDLDQVRSKSGLYTTPGLGVNQEFEPAFSLFSGSVGENVTFSNNKIDRLAIAMEFSNPSTLSIWERAATSWIVRIGDPDQIASGTAESILLKEAKTYKWNYLGVGASAVFELVDLDISVSAGSTKFISIVPILDFVPHGQTFILSNHSPFLGGGNDSIGFNPGNGFGLGTQVPVGTNAAISVNTVPEPCPNFSLALALGTLLLYRRRFVN